MNSIYGFARVSTKHQSLKRQCDNIKAAYPNAILITEKYTGTKMSRPKWDSLCRIIESGDTIVFDEVSRMGRTGEECFECYKDLFRKGVTLVFLKEPHVNTSVYREKIQERENALGSSISTGSDSTDRFVNTIMDAVTEFMFDVAEEQIRLAFKQAEKEVLFLRQRTKEGMKQAQIAGKQIGRVSGRKYETKKARAAKQIILRNSRDFGGSNTDLEVMKIAGISRNSYYKYKAELSHI